MSVHAFDIFFSGNLSSLVGEETHSCTSINCLEVSENFLYVGCRNGLILRSSFKKSFYSSTEQTVTIHKPLNHCNLNNSPVIQMKALSAINQLLILSDETLTILNLETLALVKNLKLKNVSCFCLNENPLSEDPFTVEICVASKKRISYVHLNNDQMKVIKEVATFSTPTKMVMDGSHVCFSMGLEYCMLNILSGETQELFGIDSPEQSPIIFRVSKGEFLLTGPGGLGVFVLSQGFSEKPPINFSSVVLALTFHHPYVIAVCKQSICFYSLIDQQCKQTIAIDNVHLIVNGDGQVFASTAIDIFGLLPISWETQLGKLLSENRAEEALQLAVNVHISSNERENHQKMLKNLEQKVAFQWITSGRFKDALEMFEKCDIDPQEVINLDFKTMFEDIVTQEQYLDFYLEFLQRWRLKDIPIIQKQAVERELLKLLAKNDHEETELLEFVVTCGIDHDEICSTLKTYQKHHCLATFKAAYGKWEEAFSIWERLIKKELEDKHFPGYKHVAEELVRSQDITLIWRFSGEILKIDEEIGVKIFTSITSPSLKPRMVLDHLRNFPKSFQTYIEFLIREQRDCDDSYHTQLALIYVEDIVKQGDLHRTSPSRRMTVNKLRSLLRTSPKLDLAKLSENLDTTVFPHEHAIVCGRLGNHAAAIDTFINNLQDFEAAEEYCACVDDMKAWNTLLTACVSGSHAHKLDWVTDLLRRRPYQFDVPSALQSLPDDTKLSLVAPFVSFAVREALHLKRMKSVEVSLQKIYRLTSQFELSKLESSSFSVEQSSHCSVCKKRFDATTGFVRFPNGVVAHHSCAPSRHVCPVTGHLFYVGT